MQRTQTRKLQLERSSDHIQTEDDSIEEEGEVQVLFEFMEEIVYVSGL